MRTSTRGFGRTGVVIVIAAALLAVGAFWYWKSGTREQSIDLKTAARAKVTRGNLTVTVLQAGELESKNSKAIINDTDRQRKITFVVDDGVKVKKGDLLVELDSVDLRDDLLRVQSDVSRANADLRQAEEQREINKVKYDSELKTAQMKLELAKLDLRKYQEAEFPQLVRQKEVEITLAREELKREQSQLGWTRTLVEKGYANRQELETGQLAVTRKTLDLDRSREELRILRDYTNAKDLREKNNALAETTSELERVTKTHASEVAQSKADIDAKRTRCEITKKDEKKKQDDIAKTHIVSECDGQAFYPKFPFWSDQKIEKGASVYGRMKILEFPDLSAWRIKVKIPESIIEKIKISQEAVATIDAISNRTLRARVEKIGAVPDREGSFYASGQKAYPVSLDVLTTATGLKPGMSLMVDIITTRLLNVLQVPLQAVTSQSEKQYVYIVKGNKIARIEVKVGENNENYIQMISGVKEGDEVLLYAPVREETRASFRESPLEKAKEGDKSESPAKEKSPTDKAKSAQPNLTLPSSQKKP